MKKYHEKNDLRLSDIHGPVADSDTGIQTRNKHAEEAALQSTNLTTFDIESRVFLNDNLTAAAAKVKYLGRKLVRENKICTC